MLIECTGCDAKYRVPDEKVAGKTVRLRCKRCGTGLVVDARSVAPPPPSEASVMFSLAALTQVEQKSDTPKPMDDIAHISAGDVFAPLLVAPAAAEPGPRRTGIAAWIAAGAAFAIAAVVASVLVATRATASTQRTVSARAPTPTATPEPTLTPTATPTVTVMPTAVTAPAASETIGSRPAPYLRAPTSPTATTRAQETPQASKCCPGESDVQCEMRRAAGASCAQETKPPFDRAAALRALSSVSLAACKATGTGHVKVTFEPDGSASAAEVDDGPLVGTPAGGCVARSYRATKVPAFAGAALTVGKTFSL